MELLIDYRNKIRMENLHKKRTWTKTTTIHPLFPNPFTFHINEQLDTLLGACNVSVYLVLNIVLIYQDSGYTKTSSVWLCYVCAAVSLECIVLPNTIHTAYKIQKYINGSENSSLRNIHRRMQLSCYTISFCILWYPL